MFVFDTTMISNRQKTEAKFTEIYQKLNEEQRSAVDTLDGPVMVIAGPGTGKTQILAARIGKLLLDTDTQAGNILCLTYTDAGVVAMRKRLQQFIGAEAYKVKIYTYHAFCNDVIQDNLSLFEKTALDPISELETIALLKELIDAFPKNHPLKRYRGDIYYEVQNLKTLFSTMKKEGWTPEYINERIDHYLADLPNRDEYIYKTKYKTFKPGDLKLHKIEEETKKAEKTRAAVNEFENYQRLMHKNNRYDYEDMINWVIKAFEENKTLLAHYQETFQYILVDEFQDTSGTQNKIIQLLISYWDKPNVFIVGDDDQSIFRFQGANLQNMLDFAQQYSNELKTIVLTNNYRSTQPILDASKSLIGKNDERLIKQMPGLSKDLKAANSSIKHMKHLPVINRYSTAFEEMVGITLQIESIIATGVAPGKIAVIYKENKYGAELAHFFRLKNIPFTSKRELDLLEQPFIKKIITILQYLNAEHDVPYGGDEMLFEILHFDFYRNPSIEIAKLTVEVNRRKFKDPASSLRLLLFEKAHTPPKDLFDIEFPQSLKNFSATYEQLIADVSNLTIQQLLSQIVTKAGVLPYILHHENKIELMQFLTAFFNFVKEENRRKPRMNLEELVNLLAIMEKEKLRLPLYSVSGSDKGVNLLTAHGSKGLEFEYVFLAGSNANFWEKKNKSPKGYKIPDTVFSSQPHSDKDEELRRLFYVAITRAEKYLFITYPLFSNENKELEPSMFLAEILEQHPLSVEQKILTQEEIYQFQTLLFTEQSPVLASIEEDFINPLLSRFVLSVTALNNFLDCPLKFYYQNLLRIPSGKNENTEFGSAVHFALETLFRNMKETGSFPPVHTLLDSFNWFMQRHRESFTPESYKRRKEQGSIILPAYYNKYIDQWNKIVLVELSIRNITIEGVPVSGKIDKLEFTGKEVNVVDYKTGSTSNVKSKLTGPKKENSVGGDYWRQAVFYKLLLDNYEQKTWNVISTEFDFIEPDANNNFIKHKIFFTPEDLATVKEQITQTWQKIQQKDFYTGCGKSECHWCNFVKANTLYDELLNTEAETDET